MKNRVFARRKATDLPRRTRLWATLATCTLASVGLLRAQNKIDQAGDELRALNRQILTSTPQRKPMPDIASALKSIEAGFRDGIARYLDTAVAPSANDLRQKLERATAVPVVVPQLAGVITLGRTRKPIYVAALSLSWCPSCSRTWLGVYQSNAQHYINTVQLDNPLPNKTVQLLPLAAVQGKPQFILYGTNLGDAHTRLTIFVYSLEGHSLTTIWSREDLPGRTASVANNKLTLQYRSDLRRDAPQITQIYAIGPSGPTLERQFQTPES